MSRIDPDRSIDGPPGVIRAVLLLVTVTVLSNVMGGCALIGYGAVALEKQRRATPVNIDAEYTGLEGKAFAVVVAADRMVQADHPGVVEEMTARITEILEVQSGASGRVPANRLLAYLYENPRWVRMSRSELARDLGVQRLIFIDLIEYQLHDPGNQYLWRGVASGTVGVIEVESSLPDEFVYQKSIRIAFPEKDGFGPNDFTELQVTSILIDRFVKRASWLFFAHDERPDIGY